MAISLVLGSPGVSRNGANANVSIPVRAVMPESYAYRIQVRVNGEIWRTSNPNQNIQDTFTEIFTEPAATNKPYLFEVYYQESSAYPFTKDSEQSIAVSIPAATFIVTFNPGDGIVDDNQKIVTYGEVYGDLPRPRYSMHHFIGWNMQADGLGTFISEDDIVSIGANTTVYAAWYAISGGPSNLEVDPITHEMKLVRGDSAAIVIRCPDEPFVAGDKIEFSIRRKAKTERVVHITVLDFEEDDDGAAYIEIHPEHTSDLEFGRYVYDIQLTKASGWVTTLIETSPFVLKEEVTYDG